MHPLLRPLARKCGAKTDEQLRDFAYKIDDAFRLVGAEKDEQILASAAAADYARPQDYERAAQISLDDRGVYRPRELAVLLRQMPESPFFGKQREAVRFSEATMRGRSRTVGSVLRELAADKMKCTLCDEPKAMHEIRQTPRRGDWHPFLHFASEWFVRLAPPGLTAICDLCAGLMCKPTKNGNTSCSWDDDLINAHLAKMVGRKAREVMRAQSEAPAR